MNNHSKKQQLQIAYKHEKNALQKMQTNVSEHLRNTEVAKFKT